MQCEHQNTQSEGSVFQTGAKLHAKKVCPCGRLTVTYKHEFTLITYGSHCSNYIYDCIKITNSLFEITVFIISFRLNNDKFSQV